MTWEMVMVILVIVFLLVSFSKNLLGAGFTFALAVAVLGVVRILSPQEILSGFANDQVAVVLLLLLIGEIFRQTSLLDIAFDKLFFNVKTPRGFIGRLAGFSGPLSAFINNTPLVALLMPYVITWSKRFKVPPSKFLIPLSYIIILGGLVTLIGTSTSVIVNGLVVEQKIIPGMQRLKMFDFTYVGLPMLIIGFFYIRFIAYKIMPERHVFSDGLNKINRKYNVEMQIKCGSELIGKSLKEIPVKNLEDIKQFEIIRQGEIITENVENLVLQEDDILLFSGDPQKISELMFSAPSLVIPTVGMFSKKSSTEVIEIVISHNSSLIDKTLKEINFRQEFDATVLAMYRNGESLSGQSLGDVVVKPGDAVLLLAGGNFAKKSLQTHDFYVISKIKEFKKLGFLRAFIMIAGISVVVVLSALEVIKLFTGLLVLTLLILFFKIINPKDLIKNIDFELGLIIALSMALGTAMIKTGLATLIALNSIELFKPFGDMGLLTGIFLVTAMIAAFINTKAAIAIVFPISITIAKETGFNPTPFALIVAYAASATFITPYGYQTNIMVMGPGGYRFSDYMKAGIPLTLIYMAVAVLVLKYVFL